jgi:hypothetical protein
LISNTELKTKLKYTNNWIVEYLMIKKSLRPHLNNIYLKNNPEHTNIDESFRYVMSDLKLTEIVEQKCSYFYRLLLKNKFKVSFMENYWAKFFSLQSCINWQLIYTMKIISISDKTIAELNYKLLNNLVASNQNLYKWKIINNDKCELCNQQQTTKHMLFDCPHVTDIWRLITKIIKIKISWKIIVIGIMDSGTYLNTNHNNIIALTCFAIYKTYILKRVNKITHLNFKNQLYIELNNRNAMIKNKNRLNTLKKMCID